MVDGNVSTTQINHLAEEKMDDEKLVALATKERDSAGDALTALRGKLASDLSSGLTPTAHQLRRLVTVNERARLWDRWYTMPGTDRRAGNLRFTVESVAEDLLLGVYEPSSTDAVFRALESVRGEVAREFVLRVQGWIREEASPAREGQ